MSEILNIIGYNIRRLRKEKGYSQEKLATVSGLHRTYIGAVERGEKNISANNISAIAEALNVEPYVLMKPKHAT